MVFPGRGGSVVTSSQVRPALSVVVGPAVVIGPAGSGIGRTPIELVVVETVVAGTGVPGGEVVGEDLFATTKVITTATTTTAAPRASHRLR